MLGDYSFATLRSGSHLGDGASRARRHAPQQSDMGRRFEPFTNPYPAGGGNVDMHFVNAVLDKLEVVQHTPRSQWRRRNGSTGISSPLSLSTDFPEQSDLVLLPDEENENECSQHPASESDLNRLHAEMDQLIADSYPGRLSADKAMLLRQAADTRRIDLMSPADGRFMQTQSSRTAAAGFPMRNAQRHPREDDDGFSMWCVRGCS